MSTGAHNYVKDDVESDIEIGAVEIKDHVSDVRGSVGSNGILYAGTLNGLMLSGVDSGFIARVITATVVGAKRALDVNVTGGVAVPANRAAFTARQVTITVANTPVNLPSIVIPDGYSLVIRNSDANAAATVVFVADSAANAGAAATRYRLVETETVSLQITNANLVWVNSATAGALVDLIVEQ
jgi:hypothetical protein